MMLSPNDHSRSGSSSFDKLAKTLSKDERSKLLNRVDQVNLDDDEIIGDDLQKVLEPSSKEISGQASTRNGSLFLQSEFAKLGFLERTSLIFRAFVFRKSLNQIFVADRLAHLRKLVANKGFYINFETGGTIALRFVTEIFRLHSAVIPVSAVHLNVWKNQKALNALITNILSQDSLLSPFKVRLQDFISTENLLNIFIKTHSETSVRQAAVKAQRDYFNSIPSSIFRNVSEKLKSLYLLSGLLSFQFKELLVLMGLTKTHQREGILSKIRPVPVVSALNLLEKLFSLLMSIVRIQFDIRTNEKFFLVALCFENSEEEVAVERVEQNREISENIFKMNGLISTIQTFLSRVPLYEIIAYFRRDPFYQVPEHKVKFSIKNFYLKSSSSLLSSEISDTLEEIRVRYIQNCIDSFFADGTLSTLKYYTTRKNNIWDDLGLSYFVYSKGMSVALSFLEFDCAASNKSGSLRTLLSPTSLVRSPTLQGKFQDFFSTVEIFKRQVIDFDKLLGPESNQGKELIKYQELSSDDQEIEKLKTIQYFFDQIDNTAQSVLKNISDFLLGFVQFLKNKIIESNVEFIQTQVSAVYPELDRQKSLKTILTTWTDRAETLAVMLRELGEHQENLLKKRRK